MHLLVCGLEGDGGSRANLASHSPLEKGKAPFDKEVHKHAAKRRTPCHTGLVDTGCLRLPMFPCCRVDLVCHCVTPLSMKNNARRPRLDGNRKLQQYTEAASQQNSH